MGTEINPADKQSVGVPGWLTAVWWVTVLLLTPGGALLCFLTDFNLAFAQDPCGNNSPNNPVWICRPQVWQIDMVVPWVGWIISIAVAILGAACGKSRSLPILISAIAAVLVYVGTLVTAYQIALVNYPG